MRIVKTVDEFGGQRPVDVRTAEEWNTDPTIQMFSLFGLYYEGEPSSPESLSRCRAMLGPSEKMTRQIESKRIRSQNSNEPPDRFTVGVHIRQGDYRTWLDGRFFISPERFGEAMRDVNNCSEQQDIHFLVCSDESASGQTFQGLDVQFVGGTATEDLFVLSGCDLILSTFSSFAYFASFFGNVPIIDLSAQEALTATSIKNARPIDWPRLGVPETVDQQ
ncbi:hypothetical protein [Rubripirellula tenax]|nr:hypothetical protein [Rubripirellula tenax]